MAALDRRNPNLDEFIGLNWSCWADRGNILPSDGGSNIEDGKYGIKRPETTTLGKEDMHIFGHCPAHDEFYVVVCSHCGQVVKPQAFEKHCERRHGPVTRMCGRSSAQAPQQRPSGVNPRTERQKDARCYEAAAPSSASAPTQQHRAAKPRKQAVSLSSAKSSKENPPVPRHLSSSTPCPKVDARLSGPLPPGDCSSSTSLPEKSSVPDSAAGQSSESHCPLRGMRTYSRIYKNTNKKECELNKHCRVLDPERKKLLSRELITNVESNHQQQKAVGKPTTADQLAVEQKTASTGPDTEQLLVKSKHKDKHLEPLKEKITNQGGKYNFNGNCHLLRSRIPSELFPEEEGNTTVGVDVQPPYPFNQNLLSSEDSEEDEHEEITDLPATPWHPKPLGLCTFGCRTLGCSIFTFDRRLHHLRFALSAMLDRHVDAHLWKKMPRVSPGLRSRHVTPPTVGTPVRTGDKLSKSTSSLCLDSTSLGQLETKSSQQNSHGTKRPYSTTSASLVSGRRCTPAGRPAKAQRKEAELMQDASAAQKAAKLLNSSAEKNARHIRDTPLDEEDQPHVASSPGPASSTFSQGKKPCPPLPLKTPAEQLSDLEKCSPLPAPNHRSVHSRGRRPGLQQKVVDYSSTGLPQKRKGGGDSLHLGSSKYKSLSSSSRSGLVSWNGENVEDVLTWGLDKRSDP
ncbi:ataxin-7-like protein 2b [Mugil cephalus]|uniref:ataxin-7-like protein 2b n=1 Tax=Mugil cephalus TaxID=48193 RepID=UPI001FB6A198|nr:ataxin-7-like protein 2b [Mugil cephalus]